MSRRKNPRKPRDEGPLLNALLGRAVARRMRFGSVVLIVVLVAGGCALFLFESQTLGLVALVLGIGWALFWAGLKYLAKTGEALDDAIKRTRGALIATGLLTVATGWLAFFTLWEELGLLLVVLGALPLLLVITGVKSDPLASPLDGPPFGETGPT